MALNKILLAHQFNEVAAVSAAEQVVKILKEYACAPGSKQFKRHRVAANERWMQLRDLASNRLGEIMSD